ncbi:MAG TPA: nitroreductase [Thermodesulfobacteriota bacterium]|nr:nitroreductase [Deltaproteobacteria bacterium]HNR13927.1 nitroreductase [Thermodesulfobacteriota bacterium]HNU72858.1 nitroreductase [Thermodesulfobacteriota bacterium]HOC38825.1 nitroreductase [Thermodesulfobacteriota bacterium]
MDFFQCLTERASCRAFLPQEVSRNVLEKIITSANQSPSYMNSQPWEVLAVGGKTRERLVHKLLEKAANQAEPEPDLPFPVQWPETTGRRATDHRMRRWRALGIDSEDQSRIRDQFLANFRFYDAPWVLFVGVERTLTSWPIFDLGSFVHALLLSAHAEGLGACPQAAPLSYPDVIRTELGISDRLLLVLAIPLGYPDWEAPANSYRSSRKELSEYVRFFED